MTHHKKPPTWFGQGYGNHPGWDKAVAHCRDLLVAWARRGYVGTYSEVSTTVDEIDWPEGPFTHHGAQIGYLLGYATVVEWLEDRPLLSALVVQATEGHPGAGFFKLAKELGELTGHGEEGHLSFWTSEVQRCHEYWASR
jgi:hypothetical protein